MLKMLTKLGYKLQTLVNDSQTRAATIGVVLVGEVTLMVLLVVVLVKVL